MSVSRMFVKQLSMLGTSSIDGALVDKLAAGAVTTASLLLDVLSKNKCTSVI